LISPGLRRCFALLTLCVCLFAITPVLVIVIESFTTTDYVVFPPPGLSFKWYFEIANRREFLESGVASCIIAVVTAILSTTLGTMVAFALTRFRFAGRGLLQALFIAPFSLPGLVLGLAILQFLASRGIPRGLLSLIAAHLVITIPFTIRFVSVALVSYDRDSERAAQSLGASPWRTFWRVTLPLIRPGAVASLVFSFILSFDEVAASLFLSSPTVTTLPVRIFTYIDQSYDPLVTSASSLLVFFALVALLIIERTVGMARLFGLR
jgi:putative spermidine/putrescine transport system permease protein